MTIMNRLFLFLMGLLPLLLAASALATSRPTIYTVNYPLAYFAERIGGDLVEVVFPAPADVDPAFWKPDGAIIEAYQKADLILLNGADYAKWTHKVSLPLLRAVNTSRSFRTDYLSIDTEVTHSHGPGGDHSHTGTAFTTWLDLSLAARQAEEIFKALARKLPDHEAEIERNFQALEADLLNLDKQLRSLTISQPDLPLFGSHPIYQYFARGYNLNIRMVMWEPDEDPGEQQWRELQTMIEEHQARWMLWEGPPRPESIDRLKEMGINSLVFSPCFNRPEQGNFLTVMQHNIDNLAIAFEQAD